MMALYNLRLWIGKSLPPAQMLVPFYVALWNSLKGGVDDYSKSLAHCLEMGADFSAMRGLDTILYVATLQWLAFV